MIAFREVSAKDLNMNAFKAIGEDWMLVAAGNEKHTNALTASWGGIGVLWNKNVSFIFIRQSRFTKEFIDAGDSFSLNFFDHEKHAKMLSYMGTVSGRDERKIEKQGLTIMQDCGTPYFAEAKTVIICRKIAKSELLPETFLDSGVDAAFYKDKDYHTMYVGEVIKVLEQDD